MSECCETFLRQKFDGRLVGVLRASPWNRPSVAYIRRMIWERRLAPRITGRTSGKTRNVCPTRAELRVSGFGEFLHKGLRRVRYLRYTFGM